MSYEQVGAVLTEVCRYHRRVEQLFKRLARRVGQPRAKLLLESMSDHEGELAQALEAYLADAPASVLNTWLGRRIDLPTALSVGDLEVREGASIDELLQIGLDLDDRLIGVLQDCADCCGPEPVQQLFRSFVEQQQQEERLLARQAMRSLDL